MQIDSCAQARGAGFSLPCRHSCRHLGVETSLDAARITRQLLRTALPAAPSPHEPLLLARRVGGVGGRDNIGFVRLSRESRAGRLGRYWTRMVPSACSCGSKQAERPVRRSNL